MVEYEAEQIQVLEGLEAVRKRPGMYIGSTGVDGLHHLVYEIVDNSVDEALAGYGTRVDVSLGEDSEGPFVRVTDNGRGIPVANHPAYPGMSTLEVVMTKLHAGGKFGGGGYAVSGGLHGVGISVVNALSTRVDVTIERDGWQWFQQFRDGGTPVAEIAKGAKVGKGKTGTAVVFWPDPGIFTETTEMNYATLARRFRDTAYLVPGLTITLTDTREGTERSDSFHADGGVSDMVKMLNATRKAVHAQVISIKGTDTELTAEVDVAIQFVEEFVESTHSFVNVVATREGGTHEEGFRTALTKALNRFGTDNKLLKSGNLTGDDCREGLTAVISLRIADPIFEGQTKGKLGSPAAKGFVQSVVYEQMLTWLGTHTAAAKAITKRCIEAQSARIAATKAREVTRKAAKAETGLYMPGKLIDCTGKDRGAAELFIVEGDSAGGSGVKCRNRDIQALLPLKGKILNVEKAKTRDVLGNTEVLSIITALGCGFGKDLDVTKLRYGKIVLMTDADVDGGHITSLLLTLLYRYFRPVVEAGHVYVAQPPLYHVKWRGTRYYVADDTELDKFRKEHNGPIELGRFKGLGEMNPSELWDTTMNPATRSLLQIRVDDAVTADESVSLLMGSDAAARRAWIAERAADILGNLDI